MEAVNGVSEVDKGGPPAPSPLTGCYLLIVVGEPHSKEHKDIILRRIAKGLLSWDVGDCHVDLEKELAIITEQAPEGEDARYGERLIQFASENLVTEILIHPAISTLSQCMKNLLSSFTRHRHIIHAGYTFAANGSWILQDGTFSLTDFSEAFQEIEVQRVLRAYDSSISLDIHCSPEGDWTRLPKESFAKNCKLRVNPNDVLTSGSPAIVNFLNYVSPFLVPTDIETLLESSDVVGNIRFSHPTLYVFPGGQGDAALFGINGFNMLVDGGFARKACFWDFVRHLDRLDAVLLTRLNNSNVNGISSVLRRKRYNTVYPQIGHFFCNIQERKSILSPDGDKDKDPLLINLLEEGHEIVSNLRQLNLQPQVCYRDVEPINLYHKVGHGTLDMYVLSPARESKEVREFLQKWNTNDHRLFANQKNGREFSIPTQNLVSICALLVWQPANANDNITRILFPGSTPQHKIFEGLDRLKQLECIKHPTCSAKTLTPCLIKSKQTKADKIMQEQRDSKIKEKLVQHPESKAKVENKVAEENIKNVQSNGIATEQIISDKQIKKHDSTESEKSGPQSGEIRKTDLDKEVTNIVNGKSTDDKTIDKGRVKPKSDQKPKPDAKVYKHTRSIERKPKPTVEKKASPTTPKKTLNGETKAKTPMKVSPSATPAKSAKDANNRKVVESKYKIAPKKETPAKPEKKEVKERKPISRRPKGASPTGKVLESPVKKLNELHKVEARKPKLEKEGTTDSSTVSTPSADVETTLKKDISKLTPEELEQLKARELAELKEEQEVVKEIEAVFQKSEHKITDDSDLRKVKNISVDDKTEGEGEEYLIIEKEEIEHDSLDDKEIKESETQKHLRDSEESEKQRKLSGEIAVEEKTAAIGETIDQVKANDDATPPTAKIKDEKEQPKEISKEISVTSPDEKVDVSSGKKITDRDGDEENKEANILESQPDEKFSTPIESGATTAPTLPEDERIPLDEIKEDNGDQAIEEKYVKEDTKEKEVPIVHLPPKTTEAVAKIPTVVGIRLDKQTPIRDLVKTPDEVADLPVHEEVDIENYEHFQATQSQTSKHEDSKHISSTKMTPKLTQAEKETIIKTDENIEKISIEKEKEKLSEEAMHPEEPKTTQKDENSKEHILTAEIEEKKEPKEHFEVSQKIPEKAEEDAKVHEIAEARKEDDRTEIKEIASEIVKESITTVLEKTETEGGAKEIKVEEINDKIVSTTHDKDFQELEQKVGKMGESLTEKKIEQSPLETHTDEVEKVSIGELKDKTTTFNEKIHEDKLSEKIEIDVKRKEEVDPKLQITQLVQEKKEQVAVGASDTGKRENIPVESSTKAEMTEIVESKELEQETEVTQKQKIDENEKIYKAETVTEKVELETEKDQFKASDKVVDVKKDQEIVKVDTAKLQEKAGKSDSNLEDKTTKVEEKADIKIIEDLVKDSVSQNQDDVEENIMAIEKELVAVISDKDILEEKSDKPEKEQILDSKDLTHGQIKQKEESVTKKDEHADKITEERTEIKDKEQSHEMPTETKETMKTATEDSIDENKTKRVQKEKINEPQKDDTSHTHVEVTETVEIELEHKVTEPTLVQKDIESQPKVTEIAVQEKVEKKDSDGAEKQTLESKEIGKQDKLSEKEEAGTHKELGTDTLSSDDTAAIRIESKLEQSTIHDLKEIDASTTNQITSESKVSEIPDTVDKEDTNQVIQSTKVEHKDIVHLTKKSDDTCGLLESTKKDDLKSVSVTDTTKEVQKLDKEPSKDINKDDNKLHLESSEDQKGSNLKQAVIKDDINKTDKRDEKGVQDIKDIEKFSKEESVLEFERPKSETEIKHSVVKDKEDTTEKLSEKSHQLKENELKETKADKLEEHDKIPIDSVLIEKSVTEKQEKEECKEHIDDSTNKTKETILDVKEEIQPTESLHDVEQLDKKTTLTSQADIEKMKDTTEEFTSSIEEYDNKEEKLEIETTTESKVETEKKHKTKDSVPEISVEPPSITDNVISNLELDDVALEDKKADTKKDKHQDIEVESKSTTDSVKNIEPELQTTKKEAKEVETSIIADKIQSDLKSDSADKDEHQVKGVESMSAANLVKDAESEEQSIKKEIGTAAIIDKVEPDLKVDSMAKESESADANKDEHEKEGEGKSVTNLVKEVELEPHSIKKETKELETAIIASKVISDVKLDTVIKESKTDEGEKAEHHEKEVESKSTINFVKDVEPQSIKQETRELETVTITTDKVTSELHSTTKEGKTADVERDEQKAPAVESKSITDLVKKVEPERQSVKMETETATTSDKVASDVDVYSKAKESKTTDVGQNEKDVKIAEITVKDEFGVKVDSVSKESKIADIEKGEHQEEEIRKKSITDTAEVVEFDLPSIKNEIKELDEPVKDEQHKIESTNKFEKLVDSPISKSDIIEPVIKDASKDEKEIQQKILEKPEILKTEAEPSGKTDDNTTMTAFRETAFREDSLEISRIDKKLQEMKEAVDTEDKHGSDIKLDQQIKSDSQSKNEIDIVDKIELGRKSPKEREQDVALIVASVAEVLKSDAPLEEFEGKIPLEIAPFSPYTPYATELRETHITTVESPIREVIISDKIQMHAIEEEKISPKDPISEFLQEERKIAPLHTDYDSLQKDDSRVSSLIKDSTELIQATSKIISDIKQSSKVDEDVVAAEEKAPKVEKLLDDAVILKDKDVEKKDTAVEDKNIAIEKSSSILDIIPGSTDVEASLIKKEVDIKLESPILSDKTTVDKEEALKVEEKCLTISGKSTTDIKESGKDAIEVDKSSIASGKSTPDIKESAKDAIEVDTFSIPSGKSTPDIKESVKDAIEVDKSSIPSGKSTPELKESKKETSDVVETPLIETKAISEISQTKEHSKGTLEDRDTNLIKQAEKPTEPVSSVTSSSEIKHLPDTVHTETAKTSEVDEKIAAVIKEDLSKNLVISDKEGSEVQKIMTVEKDQASGKTTPDIINKSSIESGKTSPMIISKDTLVTEVNAATSGKSTPEIIEPPKNDIQTGKSPVLSGKSTPDIIIDEDKSSIASGRLTPDTEEPAMQKESSIPLSESSKSDTATVISVQSTQSESATKQPIEQVHCDKPLPSEVCHVEASSNVDVKQPTTDLDSVAALQDVKESKTLDECEMSTTQTTEEKSVEGSRKSIPDIKEVSKSETVTTDTKQLEPIQKLPVSSGKTTPDLHDYSKNDVDLVKMSTESEKSTPLSKESEGAVEKIEKVTEISDTIKSIEKTIAKDISQEKSSSETKHTESLQITETKDQHVASEHMTKGESIAGPSSSSKREHLSPAKSPTEELELSRKSTPDIADIAKGKESEESSLGRTTPPTVPVSPIVKEKRPSLHDQEKDDKKDVPEVSALKTVDVRSSTPASDDCDISSGQVSRILTTEEEDEKQVYSDDEDLPGSPLSATSQVAHSTSSQYDFEDSVRGVAQIDPMSTSFYGALPDDPIDLSKEMKTGRFLDESDLDFEKALFEHQLTRGEGLSSSSSPSHAYEITTAKYSSIKLQEETQKPDASATALQKESLMTSSFIGTELPKDPKEDPIASWGKPLGLPSPAPLNDNKGTPKKERKIPPSVMAKNKLNEDKKLSDSKYDKKGRKINPVYVDLTYVPHHGNSNYSYVDFFKRVRARYYVFSGIEPSKEVYTALLEAKQTWDDKELEVTIIPTYDTDVLGYWVAENEDLLAKYKIDLSPSASRCTINLQDHETSCSAYRLEFS